MDRLKKRQPFVLIYKFIMTVLWSVLISYYYVRNKLFKDVVFCEGFIEIKWLHSKKNNWGDDINKYFFEYITGKKFIYIPYDRTLLKHRIKRYSMIGSIIGMYSMDNLIIYGSGLMDPRQPMRGHTTQPIISVRGPKTREWLMEKGYDCPENYGDPALLLPLFYRPQRIKGKICLIPHKSTVDNRVVKEISGKYSCKVLDMEHYNKWTDIIDEVVTSEFVLSESLHGLIVAETYGIPNIWVEYREHWENWEFKFEDYFESLGKKGIKSIQLYNGYDWSDILMQINQWKKCDLDYDKMLKLLPFPCVVEARIK